MKQLLFELIVEYNQLATLGIDAPLKIVRTPTAQIDERTGQPRFKEEITTYREFFLKEELLPYEEARQRAEKLRDAQSLRELDLKTNLTFSSSRYADLRWLAELKARQVVKSKMQAIESQIALLTQAELESQQLDDELKQKINLIPERQGSFMWCYKALSLIGAFEPVGTYSPLIHGTQFLGLQKKILPQATSEGEEPEEEYKTQYEEKKNALRKDKVSSSDEN